ncbi:MAG: T9SS type A sorting domain-containing protein [Flavobacterium sp.]
MAFKNLANLNLQVNISDLSSVVYRMKIVSDKGTITKKVIKE